MASSITISGDSLLELFDSLSLTSSGNGVYIYSGKDEIGDEPGAVTTLKGLSVNDDNTFFASYVVEADKSDLDEFFLTNESVQLISSVVGLILDNCEPDEDEVAEEDSDDDFYVAVRLDFEDEQSGDTMISIRPATGDHEVDKKFGGFLTQRIDENEVDEFPAHQIARVIRGEGLSEPPLYVDKMDVHDNALEVNNGNVVVWDSGSKDPLSLAMRKARSMKLPLCIEKFHASRIHGVRIGENWFGAIAPVPMNKSDLSDQGIFADTESLNAEYDFTGLRSKDKVELEEPTQIADEEEEYDDEVEENSESEVGDEDVSGDDVDDVDDEESDSEFDDGSEMVELPFDDEEDDVEDDDLSGVSFDDEEDADDESDDGSEPDASSDDLDDEIAALIDEELDDDLDEDDE